MNINCQKEAYRDTYINGLPKLNSKWNSIDNDGLVASVVKQVCDVKLP